MARIARVVIPEVAMHVVQRGHNRAPCFFGEHDYRAYLELLQTFAVECACTVHAYCLMTNHVHLLLTPTEGVSCALLMKNVGQRYVQRINRERKRTGTLWEGRYFSCLVLEERHALNCYRYIEANPMRAGMVANAGDYPWSSYSQNALGTWDFDLAPHAAYAALGTDPARRAQAYRRICADRLDEESMNEIRQATRTGRVVGAMPGQRGRPARCK